MPSEPQHQVKRPFSAALAERYFPLPVAAGRGSSAVASGVFLLLSASGIGD